MADGAGVGGRAGWAGGAVGAREAGVCVCVCDSVFIGVTVKQR